MEQVDRLFEFISPLVRDPSSDEGGAPPADDEVTSFVYPDGSGAWRFSWHRAPLFGGIELLTQTVDCPAPTASLH